MKGRERSADLIRQLSDALEAEGELSVSVARPDGSFAARSARPRAPGRLRTALARLLAAVLTSTALVGAAHSLPRLALATRHDRSRP